MMGTEYQEHTKTGRRSGKIASHEMTQKVRGLQLMFIFYLGYN